jgi:hypothetical protein
MFLFEFFSQYREICEGEEKDEKYAADAEGQ